MADPREVINILETRFTSGNDVPVSQARITRDEWEAIKHILFEWRVDHCFRCRGAGCLECFPGLEE